MRKRAIALITAVVATGVLVAGCGDDGDAGAEDAPPLPKAEFVKQANAICAANAKKIEEDASTVIQEVQKTGSIADSVQEELVDDTLVPNIESEIEEISELGTPKGGEKQVNAFLDSTQAVVDEAQANPAKFIKVISPFDEAEALANKYGLTSCPVQ